MPGRDNSTVRHGTATYERCSRSPPPRTPSRAGDSPHTELAASGSGLRQTIADPTNSSKSGVRPRRRGGPRRGERLGHHGRADEWLVAAHAAARGCGLPGKSRPRRMRRRRRQQELDEHHPVFHRLCQLFAPPIGQLTSRAEVGHSMIGSAFIRTTGHVRPPVKGGAPLTRHVRFRSSSC